MHEVTGALEQNARMSFKVVIIVSLAALIVACSSPLTEEELLSRAQEAFDRGDVAATELDVKAVLQGDPSNTVARSLYGQIYLYKMDPEPAVGEFERSLAGEELPETRLLLAKALVQSGDTAELVSRVYAGDYASIRQVPEFRAVLARAKLAQAEYGSAREELAAALTESGNDYIDITAAILALQLDSDKDTASALLESVVERNPSEASALSLLGIVATANDQHADAETYFTQATETNPFRLSDRLRLVDSQIRQGKGDAAHIELAKLERLVPNAPQVNFLRGQLFFDEGEYENAIDAFAQVLTVMPSHPEALLLSANANLREQNLGIAQRQFTQFLSMRPEHSQAGLQLSNVWLQLGEPAKAEEAAREILKEHKMNLAALNLLAIALSAQGMHAESAEAYAQMVAARPDSVEARVALGAQQVVAGNVVEGIDQLKAAVGSDQANESGYERLIEALLLVSRLDEAKRVASDYVELAPDKPRPLVYLGRVLLKREDYSAAQDAFNAALAMEPGHVAASGGLATLALLDDDLGAAKRAFEAALEENPGDIPSIMNLASLLEQTGETERMVEILQTAVEINPSVPEPRLALARHNLMLGRPGVAVSLVAPFVSVDPDDPRVHRILANAYLSSGQPELAAGSGRELLRLSGDDPTALALVARVDLANRQPESAEQHLESALQELPESSALRRLLIESYLAQRKLEAAENEIAKLPETIQNDPEVLVVRGRISVANDDFARAKKHFKAAFESRRNNFYLSLLTGAQWALGERETVISALSAWLVEYPSDVLIRTELASRYLLIEESGNAIEQYERLLELQPNNVVALNNLGWLLREADTSKALEYVKTAEGLAPTSADIKDTYAMVELERGEFDRALMLNERALEMSGDDPGVRLNRAQILIAAGRLSEARRILEGLVNGPAFASQAQASTLLSELN
ncbi:MAG: hypothetical protein Cons2KO_19090 [Congregibacter sp.]